MMRWVVRTASALSGVALVILVGGTVADVVLRWISGRGIAGSTEIAEVLLVVVIYLALADSEMSEQNIRVTLVTSRLPDVPARLFRRIGDFVAILMIAWLTSATTVRAFESWQVNEYRYGVMSVPMWQARIAVAFGFLLLGLIIISRMMIETRSES